MVETDGIVIGIAGACAIAGCAQIARAFRLARAQTEVMSEQDEIFEALGLVAIEPFERPANPSMKLDPALQKQVLIDHVLKHGLREAVGPQRNRVRARDLLDDLRVAQKLEPCFKPCRLGCRRTESSRIKPRADHGGFLCQAAHLMRQPVETRQQQRLNACRNIGGGFIRFHPPLRAVALQGAGFDQAAYDLLEEKRIAAGAIEDSTEQSSRRFTPTVTEIGREQPLSVGVAKRGQPEGCVTDPARAELVQFQHRPMRKQQHQPRPLQSVHQEPQRFKRHRIGPMQILDDDQQRRQCQAAFEDGANREEYLPAELFGLDMPERGVGVAEAEDVQIEGHQAVGLVGREAKLRQRFGDLCLRLCGARLLRNAIGAAQHGGESAVGLFAKRRARRVPDRHAGESILVADARDEFADQARFPDAGFTDQPHQLSRAAARAIKAADQARKLDVAPDQRRIEAQRVETARRTGRVERLLQTVDQHAAHLALQRDLAKRVIGERMPRQTVGQRPDQHLARSRHRL
ncbi:hypothetical protein ABIF72_003475 [Bradyrhizobium japonicum]